VISTKIKQGKLYKKYNLRCNYCGTDNFFPFFLLKIFFLFSDKKYVSCPKCHKTTCWRTTYNMVPDHTDKKEKELNRNIWDRRIK